MDIPEVFSPTSASQTHREIPLLTIPSWGKQISKVHLFHEKWKLVIGINLTSTEERVKTINKTMNLIKLACNKNCTPQFEIKIIELRYNRLVTKENILQNIPIRKTTS